MLKDRLGNVIPEWGVAIKPNPNQESDDGFSVPEAYRFVRDHYSDKPKDIGSFRKQLMYRCGRFGTKEIEIVLTDWFKANGAGLSYSDLE